MDKFKDTSNNEYIKHPQVLKIESLLEYVADNGPVNFIVALGHNWDKSTSMPGILSIPSKINAITSYLLWRLGITEKIIFSGGSTVGGGGKTEARAMQEYVRSLLYSTSVGPDITSAELFALINKFEDATILEETSYDTYTNAQEVKKVIPEPLDEADKKSYGLLSVGYHLIPRALPIFEANGVTNCRLGLASDNLLKEIFELLEKDLGRLPEYSRINGHIKYLIEDYIKFLLFPIQKTEEGKIKMRAHGPEYHLMAATLQSLTGDLTGQKLNNKASKMRVPNS